jgi:VWFA-related protein
MLDSSTSMTEEIREAEEAAAKFFEHVLEPKDRAAVIVFSDTPLLRVALTNDTVLLNNGLAGIEADGETSLYDSLVYGLYYLAGLRGKRALILLSDGADSVSRFSFNQALEFAKRSGVAVYTIGLGLKGSDVSEYAVLRKLARETGGDCFFIDNARRLDRIYTRIEDDLRSQYLLGYQSPQQESRDYREVRVEVTRSDLEVKTVPGYYP